MATAKTNGTAKADVAAKAVRAELAEAEPLPKVWLHQKALKPRDFIRARVALKDVLGDRAPVDLLDPDTDEHWAFLIWCQRSRNDQSFSWDDALDTDFDECVLGDERPPPPTPLLEPSGSGETPPSENGSNVNESNLPPRSPEDEHNFARTLT